MLLVIVVASVLLLALSAVFSAAETSVILLSPGRIHRLSESDRRGAGPLTRLAEHRHRLRAVAAFTGVVAAGVSAHAGALLGALALSVSLPADGTTPQVALVSVAEVLGALVALALLYSLGQALPRTMAATNPERIALDAAPVVVPVMKALYPLAALLGGPWKWVVDVIGAERTMPPWAVSAEWRGANLEEDAERDVAEEAILEAVSDFGEKIVREVMVPRTDMEALPDSATATDAVALISATGFSRIPIYHDTVDDVRAVLYAKDLLSALADGGADKRVVGLARPAYFVPETKPIEELLVEMRTRTHIAIVADEYGGTAGMVTLEDLLEEIVGEISDEYDREEALLVDLGAGRYRVDARLPVDDLNEAFATDIEIDADSVGGLFTEFAGHIPELGESIEIEGLRLIVTDLEGNRIRQLIVEPATSPTEGAEIA